MLQSLILMDSLSSACWEEKIKKKKKKKKKNNQGAFFPGQGIPCWLCHTGFSQLLGAING
jgi:hypothetical protein